MQLLDLIAAEPALGAPVSDRPGRLDIAAQVVRAVTVEGARTLDDVIDRRLVLGTLGGVTADEVRRVAAVVAPVMGWVDDGRAEAEAEIGRRRALEARWHATRST